MSREDGGSRSGARFHIRLGRSPHDSGTSIEMDGRDITGFVQGVSVESTVNMLTRVTLAFLPEDLLLEIEDAEVSHTHAGVHGEDVESP